jgi:hypothetical protein
MEPLRILLPDHEIRRRCVASGRDDASFKSGTLQGGAAVSRSGRPASRLVMAQSQSMSLPQLAGSHLVSFISAILIISEMVGRSQAYGHGRLSGLRCF